MPDPLSATLSALADPTRRAILARLSQGEACVNDLAAPFSISQPANFKTSEGPGESGPHHSRPGSAVAAVPARCRAATGCCELARKLPAFLGGELRPARRLSEGLAKGESR